MVLDLWFLITILTTCRASSTKETRLDYSSLEALNDLTRGVFFDSRRSKSERENGPSVDAMGTSQDSIRRTRKADAAADPFNENSPMIPYNADVAEDNYEFGFARNVPVGGRSSHDENYFVGRVDPATTNPSNDDTLDRSNDRSTNQNIDVESARSGFKTRHDTVRITPLYRSVMIYEPSNINRQSDGKTNTEDDENLFVIPLQNKVPPGAKQRQGYVRYAPDVHLQNAIENSDGSGNITGPNERSIDQRNGPEPADEASVTKDQSTTGNPSTNQQNDDLSVIPLRPSARQQKCDACSARKEYEIQKHSCFHCKQSETQKRERYETIKVLQIRQQCEVCRIKIKEMQTHCELCIVRESEMHINCEHCSYRSIYHDSQCAGSCSSGQHNGPPGPGKDTGSSEMSQKADAQANAEAAAYAITQDGSQTNPNMPPGGPYNRRSFRNRVENYGKQFMPPVPFGPPSW